VPLEAARAWLEAGHSSHPGIISSGNHHLAPRLYLFDIDGTILRAGTRVHREAFAYAYETVYGLPLSLDGIAAGGRTDAWLLKEPLRRHGLTDEAIAVRMPDAFLAMQDYVEERLGDLRERVLPGVPEVLAGLQGADQILGLLTGNLSRIAMAKMRHAGLLQYFDTGAFGEESETRADLVPVALREAGGKVGRPLTPHDAVLVGDTPLDVEAGRAHGTRTCGVATGPFPAAALVSASADLVLESFADPDGAVEQLLALG
jgi:phosphoglycolate phosphatase-like HAD superfamily hydrolase